MLRNCEEVLLNSIGFEYKASQAAGARECGL